MSPTATEVQQSWLDLRQDFPSLNRTWKNYPLAYFDGPGGTQVPKQVIDAVVSYYATCNANTHGQFVTSRESDQMIETARQTVCSFLNASSPGEISFGANMTSLNFALSHALARSLRAGDEILITQLDHEANRGPWLRLRERGITIREARMTQDGSLDYEDLRRKVNEKTRIVALGWASNALGTVNRMAHIREWTRQVGAWLVIDAVHYAAHFPVDVERIGADFLLCSAYKFYGPHVGILYSRQNLLGQLDTDRLRTQDSRAPYRIETGTLNHASIAGVTAAIEYLAALGSGDTLRDRIRTGMEAIGKHEYDLASKFHLEASKIPGVVLYGPPFEAQRRAPTISFTVSGRSPQDVAASLGDKGLLVWDGDFYAARAVEILGLREQGGLVRVGFSAYSTSEELNRLLAALRSLPITKQTAKERVT